jgi:DDE family transposase
VVDAAVGGAFRDLRRTIQKNLALLTVAFLRVVGAARSGHGQLSLAALFRVLPTVGSAHSREKRLHRFLANHRLDPRGVTEGLARLILGKRGPGLWPIVFDQTKAGSTQALLAGVPFEGRTLPLAVYTFEYPWKELTAKSQNWLEEVFLVDLEEALPTQAKAVFIGDRGYARASLLRSSARLGRLYLIRGRTGTKVEYQGRQCKLGELPVETGKAIRYCGVFYQAQERVPVDVIAFHDPAFKEPWWLLVPAGTAKILATKTVVAMYRERMQVEHSFRDFKTHLGLRGLRLKVRIAERTGRLLLAFCIAYCLALVLGVSPEAQRARLDLEVQRRRPRHGTRRTLSVLSLAMLMLSHPRWRVSAWRRLQLIAARIAQGKRADKRAPPNLTQRLRRAA